MRCPDCGREMERKQGFWLCKHIGYSIHIRIKKSKVGIGYCTECGEFSQRLYDYGVLGLCDTCSMDALYAAGSLSQNTEENKLVRMLTEYRESRWKGKLS
jgi:ribosomal protein L37AE/L43A